MDRSASHPESSSAKQWAEIELLDTSGQRVRLGQAWAEQPALLVFIRHFG